MAKYTLGAGASTDDPDVVVVSDANEVVVSYSSEVVKPKPRPKPKPKLKPKLKPKPKSKGSKAKRSAGSGFYTGTKPLSERDAARLLWSLRSANVDSDSAGAIPWRP